MGLYIKDIVLPEDPNEIIEFAVKGDGALYVIGEHYWPDAIEVPEPHGDLIDRDKLRAKEFIHNGDAYAVVMSRDIRNAPAVIPASKGG